MISASVVMLPRRWEEGWVRAGSFKTMTTSRAMRSPAEPAPKNSSRQLICASARPMITRPSIIPAEAPAVKRDMTSWRRAELKRSASMETEAGVVPASPMPTQILATTSETYPVTRPMPKVARLNRDRQVAMIHLRLYMSANIAIGTAITP